MATNDKPAEPATPVAAADNNSAVDAMAANIADAQRKLEDVRLALREHDVRFPSDDPAMAIISQKAANVERALGDHAAKLAEALARIEKLRR